MTPSERCSVTFTLDTLRLAANLAAPEHHLRTRLYAVAENYARDICEKHGYARSWTLDGMGYGVNGTYKDALEARLRLLEKGLVSS